MTKPTGHKQYLEKHKSSLRTLEVQEAVETLESVNKPYNPERVQKKLKKYYCKKWVYLSALWLQMEALHPKETDTESNYLSQMGSFPVHSSAIP